MHVAQTGVLGLLAAAAQNAEEATGLLDALLADYPARAALAEDILRCEHDGDRLTREIRLRVLHADDAVPCRADAQALATALDDVVDHAEEAADQLGLYAVGEPLPAAQDMAGLLAECAAQLAAAVHGLCVEAPVGEHLVAVHRLESAADVVVRDGLARLFACVDPLTVIRWKDILGGLEAAVDACETAAVVVDGIVVKAARSYPATASSSA